MQKRKFFFKKNKTDYSGEFLHKNIEDTTICETTLTNHASGGSLVKNSSSRNFKNKDRPFTQSQHQINQNNKKISRSSYMQTRYGDKSSEKQQKDKGVKSTSDFYYRSEARGWKKLSIKKKFQSNSRNNLRKQSFLYNSFDYNTRASVVDHSLLKFSGELQNLQKQFVENYRIAQFQQCAKTLLKLINFSIDANSKKWLIKSILKLAQFYGSITKQQQSLFYYNQAKQASLLLSQFDSFIASLLGMSKCCSKRNMHSYSVIILKKALQYCWFYSKEQLELLIYDELGKVFYLMGDLEKATAYHHKYTSAWKQSPQSPHRILSKQRITKQEALNISYTYNQISLLLLVNLDLPIFTTKQLPVMFKKGRTISLNQEVDEQKILNKQKKFHESRNSHNFQQSPSSYYGQLENINAGVSDCLRDKVNINQKYKFEIRPFDLEIERIMKGWVFFHQMEEPDLQIPQKLASSGSSHQKHIGFEGIDLKMNKYLKSIGIKQTIRNQHKIRSSIGYKKSLDQKVQKMMSQPGLDDDWDSKMIKSIVRDRKNNLLKVQSQIRVRGRGHQKKLESIQIRKLFPSFTGQEQRNSQI